MTNKFKQLNQFLYRYLFNLNGVLSIKCFIIYMNNYLKFNSKDSIKKYKNQKMRNYKTNIHRIKFMAHRYF